MWYETPPDELPPVDPPAEPEPEAAPETPLAAVPDQLVRDGRIPFDHSRGIEYLPGEVPLGWNEPLP